MFTVKLLGGAKKSLGKDIMEIDKDELSIFELLDILQQNTHNNQQHLDTKNLLVAINGIDSSALDGYSSIIKKNDIVTIIPIIHGGSNYIVHFSVLNTYVGIIEIKNLKIEPVEFLINLRDDFQHLVIQGIKSNYILNFEHAKKIIMVCLEAKKNNSMLSNKLETDILMRFAGTKQIDKAILKTGINKTKSFVIIAIGKKVTLHKLFRELKLFLKIHPLTKGNSLYLKKEFLITNRQLRSVLSRTPLEDLLAEKAALLFR